MPSVRPSPSPRSPAARPPYAGHAPFVPRASSAARIAACAFGVLLVAGCAAPSLRTEVTRFHAWTGAEPRTVAFRRDTAQAQTLEGRSYERLVMERLAALGFTEADPAVARYQAAFRFTATSEPRRVTDYWQPGAFGPSFSVWPGAWLGPRSLHPYPYGFGRFDPLWSLPPVPMVRDVTVWRHELKLDLFDMRSEVPGGQKVYESTAVAVAESEAMPRLMPALVSAALADFPGASGETRRVEVALPEPPR